MSHAKVCAGETLIVLLAANLDAKGYPGGNPEGDSDDGSTQRDEQEGDLATCWLSHSFHKC